jgi:predicted chitinase
MPVVDLIEQTVRLAPTCQAVYRDAFGKGQTVLERYGIADNVLRVAHFMARMLHESGALTLHYENLRYSAERLPKIWPRRFRPNGACTWRPPPGRRAAATPRHLDRKDARAVAVTTGAAGARPAAPRSARSGAAV